MPVVSDACLKYLASLESPMLEFSTIVQPPLLWNGCKNHAQVLYYIDVKCEVNLITKLNLFTIRN